MRICGLLGVAFAILFSVSLAGCGLHTPELESTQQPHMTAFLVNEIVGHVRCELGRAVLDKIDYDKQNAALNHVPRRYPWLDTFAGTLTITMTVDERGAVSPGLNYAEPLVNNRMFSLGVGGSGSAQATRKQVVDYVFNIKDDFIDNAAFYSRNAPDNISAPCERPSQIQIEGDLQIADWLDSVLFPFSNVANNFTKAPDVMTDDITFVLAFSGNATPSWRLVRFSVNPAAPFLSATRTRTNEALIAIGPAKKEPKDAKVASKGPSQTVLDFRNIALVGSAINLSVTNR